MIHETKLWCKYYLGMCYVFVLNTYPWFRIEVLFSTPFTLFNAMYTYASYKYQLINSISLMFDACHVRHFLIMTFIYSFPYDFGK